METRTEHGQDALLLNPKLVRDLLTKFLRDETSAAGFSKLVVGLSGGVDSALVTALAVEALGAKNVLALILPHRMSNPQSVSDAAIVAKSLGVRTETIDITPMVDAYCEEHKVRDNMRRGNVMARARMIVLYDQSAKEQALVVGTSNKTEIMLGYGTLHGDMASALNPIGDLYKTQVWQLAEAMGTPESIVQKKPSADLWKGQTDEGEMGFSYKDVDRLLYYMIDERRKDEELVKLGFSRAFIDRVRTMIRKSQFKRRPPIIAKVSYRTVNVDFRYVRDWGV
ncbi:MAG: NAD+ synthase [Bacteroidota bacterium]